MRTLRTRTRTALTTLAAVAVTGTLAVSPAAFAATPAAAAPAAVPASVPTAQSAASTVVLAAAATQGTHPTLRRGSTGEAVREWQTIVSYVLGEGSLAVDGRFGPRTAAATREVQRLFDLEADGVVGPLTWGATSVVHAPEGSYQLPDDVDVVGHLSRGDRGTRVAQWQRLLEADPRSTVVTVDDGVFGPATEAATRAFQSRYGLVVDGIVGPNTRAKMQEVRDDV